MERSDFLKRMQDAAEQLVIAYNRVSTDRKTFDWNQQSVYYTKAAKIFFPVLEGEEAKNPVAVLIRRFARTGLFAPVDLETLILIDRAWEYYEKKSEQAVAVQVHDQ